ncbi:MAG: tetratricopeptide repeat protein [Paludibacteraceae bacterium]|nr:tetratricopeptide repeat protein [Paludibacteraceae bacterium]
MKKISHIRLIGLLLLCALSAHAQLNTDRLTAIGRNALYYEDYVLSIQYFNQVIRLKPYLAEPYQLRAIAKVQLEDWEGALDDCNHAIEINPFISSLYYTRGFIYRQLENWEAAEQDFSSALQSAPRNRTYIALRADARMHKEDFAGAQEDLDRLLTETPDEIDLIHDKAILYIRQQDTVQAINCLERVVKKRPSEASNWSMLGTLYLMQENESDAFRCLNRAIENGSEWAGDYVNRGIISYKRHDYKTALSDYDRAVRIAPQDIQCHYNRALLLQEVGDYNHALEEYNRVISLSPQSYEMYYNRGLVRMQLMQWQKALQDFDITIKHYPYFMPAYYLASQAKIQTGDFRGAQQYRDRAYQLDRKKTTNHIYPSPRTDVEIVQKTPKERDRRKEFSVRQAQNINEPETESKYESAWRGSVQKRYADVQLEPNIELGYYAGSKELRQTNYTHPVLEELNRSGHLRAPLRFTPKDMQLTPEILSQHFEMIASLSETINSFTSSSDEKLAMLYLSRAIEEEQVRDYASAVDDCTRAIRATPKESPTLALIYLLRANMRAKQKKDIDIALRDYDEVIRLDPTISFAYYNKANLLFDKKDYEGAISFYTKALAVDPDMSEAYLNRGLTYVFIDNVKEGLKDLSSAGERGIYQAYHLISRFR